MSVTDRVVGKNGEGCFLIALALFIALVAVPGALLIQRDRDECRNRGGVPVGRGAERCIKKDSVVDIPGMR